MKAMNLAAVVLAVALGGCANTAGLEASAHRSGFDGATVVNMPPHGTACQSFDCIAIGAEWDSKDPASALFQVVVFNDITAITDAKVNINGKTHTLQPLPGLTRFNKPGELMKESRKTFVISMGTIRAMVSAEKAWIRIGTPAGYRESAIVDGQVDSKALHAMRRFLVAVDQSGR